MPKIDPDTWQASLHRTIEYLLASKDALRIDEIRITFRPLSDNLKAVDYDTHYDNGVITYRAITDG